MEGGRSCCWKFSGRRGRPPPTICARTDRLVNALKLCYWQFSHKATLQQTFFERSQFFIRKTKTNFVTIHAFDRQTDGQTLLGKTALHTMQRDKNGNNCISCFSIARFLFSQQRFQRHGRNPQAPPGTIILLNPTGTRYVGLHDFPTVHSPLAQTTIIAVQ